MQPKNDTTIGWLAHFARPCRRQLTASVLLAIGGSASGIVPYLAVAQILIALCGSEAAPGNIATWALIGLLGYLGQVWLSTLSTMLSHHAAFTILREIRTALTAKLARVPMGTVLDTPSGTFKTLLVDTVEKLELPLAHMVPELVANILIPALMMGAFFLIDWRLAFIALATIPIGLLCYMGMMKDYEQRYGRVLAAGKAMDAAIVEYIGGISVIKAYRQSAASYHKYADAVREHAAAKSTWFRQTNGYYAAGIAIMPASLLGVLPLGSWLFIEGRLAAADLITCIILSLGLVRPLIQALHYTDSLAMVDTTVQEVATVLKEKELVRTNQPMPLADHRIAFHDVCFGYGEHEVLHHLTFDFVPQGMTAIVGPSGSGKSTLARLIASYWEADRGRITIGGVDVRQLPLAQVMETVAYVSQDNFLFHRSIRENIRIGKPEASDAEVEAAARQAHCHDFIMGLPQGYDTMAGDGRQASPAVSGSAWPSPGPY